VVRRTGHVVDPAHEEWSYVTAADACTRRRLARALRRDMFRRATLGGGTLVSRPVDPSAIRLTRSEQEFWRAEAACRGEQVEFWDRDAVGSARELDDAMALRICRTCPVRWPCLLDAVAYRDEWTVRGATTPEERRRMTLDSLLGSQAS